MLGFLLNLSADLYIGNGGSKATAHCFRWLPLPSRGTLASADESVPGGSHECRLAIHISQAGSAKPFNCCTRPQS